MVTWSSSNMLKWPLWEKTRNLKLHLSIKVSWGKVGWLCLNTMSDLVLLLSSCNASERKLSALNWPGSWTRWPLYVPSNWNDSVLSFQKLLNYFSWNFPNVAVWNRSLSIQPSAQRTKLWNSFKSPFFNWEPLGSLNNNKKPKTKPKKPTNQKNQCHLWHPTVLLVQSFLQIPATGYFKINWYEGIARLSSIAIMPWSTWPLWWKESNQCGFCKRNTALLTFLVSWIS